MEKLSDNDDFKVFISDEQIAERVKQLGEEITKDYQDKNLLIVSVLKGSFIFAADLVRAINLTHRIEFVQSSSYKGSLTPSTKPELTAGKFDISAYDVLVIDDILDTGETIYAISKHFSDQQPKSLKICVLLDKISKRKIRAIPRADYTGFMIEDTFAVGYGLDLGEEYRHMKDISQLIINR